MTSFASSSSFSAAAGAAAARCKNTNNTNNVREKRNLHRFRTQKAPTSSSSSSSRTLITTRSSSIHAQVFAGTETGGKRRQASVEEVKKCSLITAIKTPYLKSGKIDLPKYDKLVEQQIAGGVQGLVVGGTTGEGQLMSWDEHIMLIAHTSKIYGDELLVVGNTGSNSTREAVHATSQGFAVGMDAALQINPYYGKTSRAGLMKHFGAVLDFGPTIVYNVPARTTQDIPSEVIFELAKHPNFAGVKECEGNERIRNYTKNGVTCWSGNDDEAHDAKWDAGAAGVISVTSNVSPKLMKELLLGPKPNPKLRDDLIPLMRWLFKEPNPIGVNTALTMLGCAEPVFRLPYAPYDEKTRQEGKKIMEAVGAEHLVSAAGEKTAGVRDVADEEFILLDEW